MVDYTDYDDEEQELEQIQELNKKNYKEDIKALLKFYQSRSKDQLNEYLRQIKELETTTIDNPSQDPFWIGYRTQKLLINRALANK